VCEGETPDSSNPLPVLKEGLDFHNYREDNIINKLPRREKTINGMNK
jgi:hypothetical protein